MLPWSLILSCVCTVAAAQRSSPSANTTSGVIIGTQTDGLNIFKGIRFAEAPVGPLRWAPPVPFVSSQVQSAMALAPSCLQQFPFASRDFFMNIFDTPGPVNGEDEDCLFLNIWAPVPSGTLKPVVIWVFGGTLEWGTASLLQYDGTSIAQNQDIVFVSFNYRTNVLGFPSSPDLPLAHNNLGYLDQELAFRWVQDNIAVFDGDKTKVTVMGWSAGSGSIADAISRHTPDDAPFRAAIMLSGCTFFTNPEPNFTTFNSFAAAVGCTQPAGSQDRLACLRNVSADAIANYTNGPQSGNFGLFATLVVDNVTKFSDPVARVQAGLTARKTILLGGMQNDGSFHAANSTDVSAFVRSLAPPANETLTVAELRAAYPDARTNMSVISDAIRDDSIHCPQMLFANALAEGGVTVFRYVYGAIFEDNQPWPTAGAWHSSELPELFGNYNRTTATRAEATLSHTFQTAFANFIKDPTRSPAPGSWPRYIPGNSTSTLAKIAYHGNVEMDDFVDLVQSDSTDGPCVAIWDKLREFGI